MKPHSLPHSRTPSLPVWVLLLLCALGVLGGSKAQAQGLTAAGVTATSGNPTNSWVAVSRPCTMFTISVYNSSSSSLWLHVFDATSVPANGSFPTLPPLEIPANKTGGWDYTVAGCKFANGIAIATSTTDVATTNGTASFQIAVTHTPK